MANYSHIQARTALAKKISDVVSAELPFSYYSGGHNDINVNGTQNTGMGSVYHITNFNDINMRYEDGQLTTITGSLIDDVPIDNKTILQAPAKFTDSEFFTKLNAWTECLRNEAQPYMIDDEGQITNIPNYNIELVNTIQVVTYFEQGSSGNSEDFPYPILKQIAWPGIDCQAISNPIFGNHIINGGLLSQNISMDGNLTTINNSQANEVLDTHIHELLTPYQDRGTEIGRFFADYNKLKGDKPIFEDYNGFYDFDVDDENQSNLLENDYHSTHDYDPNMNPQGHIPRVGENQTLEWLRNDLNEYLKDVDSTVEPFIEDQRPEYEDKSDGYLKIRNLNQSIIIRQQEGGDVGIVGEDTNSPSFLTDGFTITMWVKFLDKVNSGTLFNFGNPTRSDNPYGFKLESLILTREEYEGILIDPVTRVQQGLFQTSDTERFLRLLVYDNINKEVYDSHIGIPQFAVDDVYFGSRKDTTFFNQSYMDSFNLLWQEYDLLPSQYLLLPYDPEEWYFIVATYNPNIDEETSLNSQYIPTENPQLKHYWEGNYDPLSNNYALDTGLGTRCKVEIISKTDLLRARGFKT